jgi:hypothetical protein
MNDNRQSFADLAGLDAEAPINTAHTGGAARAAGRIGSKQGLAHQVQLRSGDVGVDGRAGGVAANTIGGRGIAAGRDVPDIERAALDRRPGDVHGDEGARRVAAGIHTVAALHAALHRQAPDARGIGLQIDLPVV